MNCFKCQRPIKAGEIAVRIDPTHMAHGQCAGSANLSAQPTIGVPDGEKLRQGVVHMPDRPKIPQAAAPTRAIVTYQGLQYFADSIQLSSDGRVIRGEAVPAIPAQTIGTVEKIESFVSDLGVTGWKLNGTFVFRQYGLFGLVMVFACTTASVVSTIIFNLISDLVGGIWISVIEEETSRPVSS